MGNATLTAPPYMQPQGPSPNSQVAPISAPSAPLSPAIQPPTTAPPSAMQLANSPLHVHTAQIMAQNPAVTPEQVSSTLGNPVTPAVAAHVMGQIRSVMMPPPSPQAPVTAQSLFQPVVSAPSAPVNPAMQQAMNPTAPSAPVRPISLMSPATAPPAPSGPFAPATPVSAGVTAPAMPSTIVPQSPNAQSLPQNADAGRNFTPQAPSSDAPATAPGSQPPNAPKGPSNLVRGLERFAPALAVALATRNNPGAGAAIIGGYGQGQERAHEQQQQDAAVKAQQGQQTFENNLKTTTESDTNRYHQDEVDEKSNALVSANNISRAIGNAANGEDARQIAIKMDPSDKSGFVAALSNPDGTAKDKNPFYSKQEQADHNSDVDTYHTALTNLAQDGKYTDARKVLFGKIAAEPDATEQANDIADFNQMFGKYGPSVPGPGSDGAPKTYYGTDESILSKINLNKAQAAAVPINSAANTSRAVSTATDANTRAGELTETIARDKVNEGIAAGHLTNDQIGTANKANMDMWTATHAGGLNKPSVLDPGNPWGSNFDALANRREPLEAARAKAQKDVETWTDKTDAQGQLVNGVYDDNGKLLQMKPVPGDLTDPITAANNQIDTIDNALTQMMKDPATGQYRTLPPTSGPTLQTPTVGVSPAPAMTVKAARSAARAAAWRGRNAGSAVTGVTAPPASLGPLPVTRVVPLPRGGNAPNYGFTQAQLLAEAQRRGLIK